VRWLGFLLCSAAACGRLGFDASLAGDGGDSPRDSHATYAPACTNFGPWGAPRRMTELNTNAVDSGGQVSADGLTIYFHSDVTGIGDLYVATRPDRASFFGAPMLISELVIGSDEDDPTVTDDQLEIYFDHITSGCFMWSQRTSTSEPWSPPVELNICGPNSMAGPYVTPDGLELYYDLNLGGGEGDPMVSRRPDRTKPFPAGDTIEELKGAGRGYVAMSGDELTMYFEQEITGPPLQLFQVSRPDLGSPFGTPIQIPGLGDGIHVDNDVSITGDGLELYFSSNRESGDLDLYVATRSCQ
jgi:hypothetical protein